MLSICTRSILYSSLSKSSINISCCRIASRPPAARTCNSLSILIMEFNCVQEQGIMCNCWNRHNILLWSQNNSWHYHLHFHIGGIPHAKKSNWIEIEEFTRWILSVSFRSSSIPVTRRNPNLCICRYGNKDIINREKEKRFLQILWQGRLFLIRTHNCARLTNTIWINTPNLTESRYNLNSLWTRNRNQQHEATQSAFTSGKINFGIFNLRSL